jgi:lipopolysaccharide export system protein LptA
MVRSFFTILCLSFCLKPAHGQGLGQINDTQDKSPIIIDAEESVVCDETARKCTATGLAKTQKGTSIVYGDILTVHFTEKRDPTAMTAQGNVRIETPRETAYGDYAHYDVGLDRVRMTGENLRLVSPNQTLTAKDSVEYWHGKKQGIARGNARLEIQEKNESIQADELIAHFCLSQENDQKMEIEKAEATGHVLASSPTGTVTGDRGIYYAKEKRIDMFGNALVEIPEKKELIQADKIIAYFEPSKDGSKKMEIEKVDAVGNVLASSPDGIVTGNRGVYYPKIEFVEMFEDVKITQGDNIIQGQYGRANLKTNLIEIFPYIPKGDSCSPHQRISGMIMPTNAKKLKKPCP